MPATQEKEEIFPNVQEIFDKVTNSAEALIVLAALKEFAARGEGEYLKLDSVTAWALNTVRLWFDVTHPDYSNDVSVAAILQEPGADSELLYPNSGLLADENDAPTQTQFYTRVTNIPGKDFSVVLSQSLFNKGKVYLATQLFKTGGTEDAKVSEVLPVGVKLHSDSYNINRMEDVVKYGFEHRAELIRKRAQSLVRATAFLDDKSLAIDLEKKIEVEDGFPLTLGEIRKILATDLEAILALNAQAAQEGLHQIGVAKRKSEFFSKLELNIIPKMERAIARIDARVSK
jgi:hypothetical protein